MKAVIDVITSIILIYVLVLAASIRVALLLTSLLHKDIKEAWGNFGLLIVYLFIIEAVVGYLHTFYDEPANKETPK